MTDRERALSEAQRLAAQIMHRLCLNVAHPTYRERHAEVSKLLLAFGLEAEARGVDWAYKLFDYDQLKTRATELRAQMSQGTLSNRDVMPGTGVYCPLPQGHPGPCGRSDDPQANPVRPMRRKV